MDNGPFIVTPYPARPTSPWKLEIRASFAGKKVRRFFPSELAAWEEGERMTGQIREKGRQSLDVGSVTVAAAVKRFQAGRSDKGQHGIHMASYLKQFVERYGPMPLEGIGPVELEKFWNRPEWKDGRATRRQAFAYLRIFYNWSERFDLVARNPIRRVTPPKTPEPLKNILTPQEMAGLLKIATDEQKAFLCLGGFAGLRSEEIIRLDPADLNWKTKEIHVRGGKTGERYVSMTSAFLRHCPREWKPANVRNWYKRLGSLNLSRNVLRHSFATYHFARGKDAAKTSFEMGNDAKLVKRVYALPAKRADHRAWWRL
jgi:integrase